MAGLSLLCVGEGSVDLALSEVGEPDVKLADEGSWLVICPDDRLLVASSADDS